MDVLQKALDSPRSTIVVGNLGRYPEYLESCFNALPVTPKGDDVLEYDGRTLTLVVEPEPGYVLNNPDWRELIFTSHLENLEYDPKTTRVVRM